MPEDTKPPMMRFKLKTWAMDGHKRLKPGTILGEDDVSEADAKKLLSAGLLVPIDEDGEELCFKCHVTFGGERACSVECFAKAGENPADFGAHVSQWEARSITRGQPKGAAEPPPPPVAPPPAPPTVTPTPAVTAGQTALLDPPPAKPAAAATTPQSPKGKAASKDKGDPAPDAKAGGEPPTT